MRRDFRLSHARQLKGFFKYIWKNLSIFGPLYSGISVVAGFIPARTLAQIFAKLSVISRTDKTGLHRAGGDKPRHYLNEIFHPFLLS
jgi:hypothetical protein